MELDASSSAQKFIIHQFSCCNSPSGRHLNTKVQLPTSNTEVIFNCDTLCEFKKCGSLNTKLPLDSSDKKILSIVTDLQNCKLTKKDLFQRILDVSEFKKEVDNFEVVLSNAIKKRVKQQLSCCKECYIKRHHGNSIVTCDHSYMGVLFSGGLDSLVIAHLAHRYVSSIYGLAFLCRNYGIISKVEEILNTASLESVFPLFFYIYSLYVFLF